VSLDGSRREFIYRLVALPGALLLARFSVGIAPAPVRLLTMWVHECGHTVAAWLCGFVAVPGPWVSTISSSRNMGFAALMTAGIGAAGYRAWKTQSRIFLCALAAVLIAQIVCTRLYSDQAMQLIIFGGDSGCLVLGSILMATFYAGEDSQLYQNSLRWAFLLIGALAFMDAYVIWTGGLQNIPFGENENGLSDPSTLTEMYNWPLQLLMRRYVRLANICLDAIAIIYFVGLAKAYARAKD